MISQIIWKKGGSATALAKWPSSAVRISIV